MTPMPLSRLRMLWSMVRGPGRSASHADRMETLYRDQAASYDAFRENFLHGRRALVESLAPPEGARVVELGGGTGRNLEYFGSRLESFSSVTVVDLCRPLLEIARERAASRGWSHVRVAEGDATVWRPEDGQPVDCVYFSYSLTMIPDWFRALENALEWLRPGGELGVTDFYISRKHPAPGAIRHRALARAFWRWWFAHDDVFVDPDHLPYLEFRTERVERMESRGKVPWLPLLRAPYFVWVGRKP